MTPVTFDHVHSSGRFDEKPAAFELALDRYRKHASVITVTEVDDNARARMLNTPGWKAVFGNKGPRDDCGIAWDTAVWEELWSGTVDVSDLTYINERGNRTGKTAAAYAVLRHRATGIIVVWSVVHTPHGMQPELRARKIRSDVGRAYISITTGTKRVSKHLARLWAADAEALSGDWNLNIRLLWARMWLRAYATAARLQVNWTGDLPARGAPGTHGGEVIDATLYRGLRLVSGPTILPRDPDDDHTAYAEKFEAAQ